MKRHPLLIDEWLLDRKKLATIIPRKKLEHVADSLLVAKRFVFDSDASRFFGEMVREYPQIISHGQEFALRPFEQMYVELDFVAYFKALGIAEDKDSDTRWGVLYSGPTAYIFAGNRSRSHGDRVAMIPMEYRLNRPATLQEELEISGVLGLSRMGLDVFYWGEVADRIPPEDLSSLRAYHSAHCLLNPGVLDKYPEFGKTTFRGAAGDMKNIIGLLLFLNRTRKILIEQEIPHARGVIGNKPSTFLRHSVVKIKLNPKPLFKKFMGRESGSWRREHDVRGHFCQSRRAHEIQCNHDWTEVAVNRWRCLGRCGGMKWWRKEHSRGHREKGIVKTSYEVTE